MNDDLNNNSNVSGAVDVPAASNTDFNIPPSSPTTDVPNVIPSQAVPIQQMPSTPEGFPQPSFEKPQNIAESSSNVEILKPQNQESLKPMEAAPTPPPVMETPKQDVTPVAPVTQVPAQPVPNVVDKRDVQDASTVTLNSSQPLTMEADKEENDFIEHVEDVHRGD